MQEIFWVFDVIVVCFVFKVMEDGKGEGLPSPSLRFWVWFTINLLT